MAAVHKKPPSFSQLIRPTAQEYDGRKWPTIARRILGHAFIALFVGIGIALFFIQPWSILTCQHAEPKQTDCRLQKRIVWVIPVQEIPITGLQSAVVHRERVTGTDENGEPTDHDVYDVILRSDSGEINLADADQRWALLSHSVADRINGYLDTPTDEPLTIWGYGLWIHTLSTLCSGSFFLVSAFVFVTFMVQSILLFGAWTTEFVLFVVGRVMDSAGLFPKARGHIPRLRQAVRGIAIQSHDNDSAQTDHQEGS